MASWNSTVDSETAAEQRTALAGNYICIAAGALVLYDGIISFGQEVELIWKWKRSAATFLFATNRVFGIVFAIGTIMQPLNLPQLSSCMGAIIYFVVSEMVLLLVWASFSALRVYAIGGRAWRTATVVFLLALGPFGVNLYYNSRFQFSEEDIRGLICVPFADIPATTEFMMVVIARSSLIASDAIVLVVTWWHTYKIRTCTHAVFMKTSLAALIMRDGTLFFSAGLVLNVAQLIAFITTINSKSNSISLNDFVTSISCIITSRFFLSVRQNSWVDSNTTPSGILLEPLPIASPGTMMGGELDIGAVLVLNGFLEDKYDSEEMEGLDSVEEMQPVVVEEVQGSSV